MISHVLAGSHQIGMVTVRPSHASELAGDPPIFGVGCLGRVAHAQEQANGTTEILLVGESRFRILEEHVRDQARLYRTARVAILPEDSPQNLEAFERLDQRRDELLGLLERLVHSLGREDTASQTVGALEQLEPTRLINALTRSIALLPVERQRLLEADSIISRFEIMGDLLRFRLAEAAGGAFGSTSLPN